MRYYMFNLSDNIMNQIPYLYIQNEVGSFVKQENLTKVDTNSIRIVIISDTHEKHEQLNIPPSDILIYCGDIVACGRRNKDEENLNKYKNFKH